MRRSVERMSKLPCPDQHVAQVPDNLRGECVPYRTLPATCQVRTCGLQATEGHHVVPKHFTRSWAERDYALLYGKVVPVKVPLCQAHHADVTENRAWFEYVPGQGFVFWTELTEGRLRTEGDPLSEASPGPGESGVSDALDFSLPSVSPEPGQSCPTCQRRIPYPKQLSSPKSKPVSYRVPSDELEEHKRILEDGAKHLGTYEQPHWQFWTYALALASVLGDPALAGAAKR